MTEARRLQHPGPRAPERYNSQACQAHPLAVTLRAGVPFDVAVAEAFAAVGFEAGYLRLSEAQFERLGYVIPDVAPGDGRAAWYSRTYQMRSATVLDAGLHLGLREGKPFLHCHGIWTEPQAEPCMGHMLAPHSVLSEDLRAHGWGISGAAFVVNPDPETGFDLFEPVARAKVSDQQGHAAALCRLRPNEDPDLLLPHAVQADQGLGETLRIEGIGSLIRTCFVKEQSETDGKASQQSYATEVLLTQGHLEAGDVPEIHAASVGFDGRFATGQLATAENRICITAELLLIAAD